MFLIFDVDGTLVDGEHTDWHCFHAAAEAVLNHPVPSAFIDDGDEVTAPALVRKVCRLTGSTHHPQLEASIRARYLENLRRAHCQNPSIFRSFPGVTLLLPVLQQIPTLSIGIVSGDWTEAVALKTKAAGVDLTGLPLATGSLLDRRTEMLRSVMMQMNARPEKTTYIGDGIWDLRAAANLGIDFIGVGHKRNILRSAGATIVAEDMHAATLLSALNLGA